jgi:hypothetical protein
MNGNDGHMYFANLTFGRTTYSLDVNYTVISTTTFSFITYKRVFSTQSFVYNRTPLFIDDYHFLMPYTG